MVSKKVSEYWLDLSAFSIAVIPMTLWIALKSLWFGLKKFGELWMDWFKLFKDDLLS